MWNLKHLLKTGIPFELLLGSLLLTFVLIFICYLRKSNWLRKSAKVLLVEYIFILVCSTIVYRPFRGAYEYNFTPLWTYVDIFEGRTVLIPEVLLNIILFVPLGLLVKAAYPQKSIILCLFFACLLSSLIELIQLLFQKGFCETDDVIHNTLGCLVGMGVFSLVRNCFRRIKE